MIEQRVITRILRKHQKHKLFSNPNLSLIRLNRRGKALTRKPMHYNSRCWQGRTSCLTSAAAPAPRCIHFRTIHIVLFVPTNCQIWTKLLTHHACLALAPCNAGVFINHCLANPGSTFFIKGKCRQSSGWTHAAAIIAPFTAIIRTNPHIGRKQANPAGFAWIRMY